MKQPKTIKLVPAPEQSKMGDWNLFPGRKAIMVDGVLYGYAMLRRAGANGAVYYFEQAGGGRVATAQKVGIRGHVRHFDIEVWGDKIASRRTPPDTRPVKVRLLERATQLVDDGMLIPEADKKAADARADRKFAAANKRAADRKAAAWRKRAASCLPGGALPNEEENELAIAKIVDLMKWAQTQ